MIQYVESAEYDYWSAVDAAEEFSRCVKLRTSCERPPSDTLLRVVKDIHSFDYDLESSVMSAEEYLDQSITAIKVNAEVRTTCEHHTNADVGFSSFSRGYRRKAPSRTLGDGCNADRYWYSCGHHLEGRNRDRWSGPFPKARPHCCSRHISSRKGMSQISLFDVMIGHIEVLISFSKRNLTLTKCNLCLEQPVNS